jgi:8-oxo-dGTP pyrophosphatase MutT (NUDIX family)
MAAEDELARLAAAIRSHAPAPFPFERIPPERMPPGGLGRAAVLVPLFPKAGEVNVLLTRRRAGLRRHAGQISFPGGRVEADEDSLAAALREAHEEVGLVRAAVQVMGPLSETIVLHSAFRLMPWVAAVPYPYPYVAAPGEVESILEVALPALAAPGAHRVERREAWGMPVEVHHFSVGAEVIWGATGRILAELVDVWRDL